VSYVGVFQDVVITLINMWPEVLMVLTTQLPWEANFSSVMEHVRYLRHGQGGARCLLFNFRMDGVSVSYMVNKL
jgi:hypothetical protein